MQTHGGTNANDAIVSSTRHLAAELLVDWNRNGLYDHDLSDLSGYVSDITTDRALSGSAPEELFLIEGSSAAELSFTVGGEYNGDGFVKVFSLFNVLSPFYNQNLVGAEVTYSIIVGTPLGNVTYPQFVGYIQTITPDRGTGTVVFTALDRVEKLRKPISLPARYTTEDQYGRRNQQSQSQSVIDSTLRLCDISVTPYRPPTKTELGVDETSADEGCLIWGTLNGWMVPTIGCSDDPLFLTGFDDAVFDSAYVANGIPHPDSPDPTQKPLSFRPSGANFASAEGVKFQVTGVPYSPFNRTHYVGFTLDTSSAGWDAVGGTFTTMLLLAMGQQNAVSVQGTATHLRVQFSGANGTLTSSSVAIPLGDDAIRCYLIADNSDATGARVYLQVGSNSTVGFEALGVQRTTHATIRYPAYLDVGDQFGLSDVSYTSLNVFGADTTDKSTALATSAAILDQGLNRLEQVPERRGVDAWDIISEVADAEMGSVFWDEQGRFTFWNYQTMLSKRSDPVRSFTLDDLTSLSSTFDLGSVRNIWTVKSTKQTAISRLTDNYIYDLSDANLLIAAPMTTTTFRLEASGFNSVLNQNSMVRESTEGGGSPFPAWPTPSLTGSIYVLSWNATGNPDGVWAENDARTGTLVHPYLDENGSLLLDVYNPYSDYVRLATEGNEAALKLRGGVVISEGEKIESVREQTSIDLYGSRNFVLSNDWVQTTFTDTEIADTLMPRTAFPLPRADSISVAGDPRIQLGDSVLIEDQDGLGARLNAQIYGITRNFNTETGLTDTYTIEAEKPHGAWDSSVYGVWGSTFTWS